jgi:hypothetical protein
MSDMKKLLESMTKFSNPKQKPGDQVRGTDKATNRKDGRHPFADKLVGGGNESVEYNTEVESLKESLLKEYRYFVEEPAAIPGATSNGPVANINPPGTGVKPPVPGQPPMPGQPPVAGQTPPPEPGSPEAAKAAQAKQTATNATRNNMMNVKSKLLPGLNVSKATDAAVKAQTNPNSMTAIDNKQLAQVATTLNPVLSNTGTTSQFNSLAQKASKMQQATQAKQAGQV